MDISDSVRRTQPLLGTFVEIAAWGVASADMEIAIEAAFGAVARVERLMSFHVSGSDVSRLTAKPKRAQSRSIPGLSRSWRSHKICIAVPEAHLTSR